MNDGKMYRFLIMIMGVIGGIQVFLWIRDQENFLTLGSGLLCLLAGTLLIFKLPKKRK